MSAKKGNETKLHEDENTDSGFLSGEQLFSSELESGANLDSDSKNLHSASVDPADVNPDSGVVCLSENLSLLDLDTPTEPPRVVEPRNADIAILNVLFQQDEDGDSQLHIAAVHGCQKSVSTLINLCPDKSWLDMPNEYGHTPLHLAAMSGHEVITRMLVVAGASIAARDRRGQTPIHIAAEMSHVECLKALLAPVKEHPMRKMAAILNQKNYNGQTCVHTAANTGHIKTLQTLVYYGADINMREGLAGSTALHIAARRADVPLVQYLLGQCPGVERSPRDWAGRTPRRIARRNSAARAFAAFKDDSDSESDEDDDSYDSDNDSLFEKLRDTLNPINVA